MWQPAGDSKQTDSTEPLGLNRSKAFKKNEKSKNKNNSDAGICIKSS